MMSKFRFSAKNLPQADAGKARAVQYQELLNRTLRRAVFVLVILAGCRAAKTQAPRFEARLIDQDANYAALVVNALAQDLSGHLWVATQSGVLLYDGARFRTFGREDGLNDPTIFSLLVDSSGTVWAGGHGGLYWFDGHRFHEAKAGAESLHIGVNSMLAASPAGEVVVETPNQLYSIERSSSADDWNVASYWQRHPGYDSKRDWNGAGFDAGQHLVMGCDEALCVFENGSRLRVLGQAEGVPPDYYVSIFLARNGVLWARGRKHIVIVPAGTDRATEVGNLLPAGALTTIHRRFTEDAAGNILTPTALGFTTWDGHAWTETDSTTQGALSGATAVFCDREGSVWIGTFGAGLLESRGYRLWSNYGREQGFANPNIRAIAEDRAGTIWFATDQSTMLLKRGATALTESPLNRRSDAANVVSLVPSADGGMWDGTQLGAIHHVDATGVIDRSTSIDAYVNRLRLARDGTLWIATHQGLFTMRCAQTGACAAKAFDGYGASHASIVDFALDADGSLWSVDKNGLSRVRNGRTASVPVLSLDHAPIAGGFDLLALAPDGTVWLSRNNIELLHARLFADHAETFERFARPQLPSEVFSILRAEPDGTVWVGTDRGLVKIDHATVSRTNYDDGMIWNVTGEDAFLAEPDGTLWVGTTLGASHLLNRKEVFTHAGFPAEVGTMHYGDASVHADERLKWTGGVADVAFAGLTYRNNQSLTYFYRLEGFDDHVITTHIPFVRFQRLPPGSYRFRVVAEDSVHNVYSIPAELRFTLLPPWWLTWWFKCLTAAAVLLLLAGIWHLSHLALLAQRRKLQRMVAERTRKLEYMVVRDGLTGLLNRNAILERLSSELEAAKSSSKAVCVSLVDLDHFKSINDTYGHLAGDAVLREAAARLQSVVRATDAIGRYGGEEFIVVFTGMEREPGNERCEQLRQALIAEPIVYQEHRLAVTCSIGLAGWIGEGESLTDLVARADSAMYDAKKDGRNRVVVIS